MVYWLIAIIFAYLFFALASLCDKIVLSDRAVEGTSSVPKPRAYTFYVGVFSIFVVLLIPFVKFSIPNTSELMWIALDAIVHVLGLYTMFVALRKFDVSKVIATIGATQPIFIFILTWIFWGPQIMPIIDILAFIVLFIGSAIISIEKNIKITTDYLKITIFSSVMFSLDYIFSKFVFLNQSFLQGIVWIRIFVFLLVLFFLISKKSRQEIFERKTVSNKTTQKVFVSAQAFGGAANLLQSFAISLAPVAFLATVNSLRGVQYALLFLIALFISSFFPKILKEEISKKIIFQKVISIIFIAIGLAILVIY